MTDVSGLPEHFVVAIDGPAGSGKSTMARLLAEAIGGVHIDTGAMYRAVTARALDDGMDVNDEAAVTMIARAMSVEFERGESGQRVIVDGRDYTARIREADVNASVSIVSAYPGVRRRMVRFQREMGKRGRVVMEGRDIGSVVFPGADVKFFLTADDTVRAGRRRQEMADAGMTAPHGQVLENVRERDRLDSSREVAPLIRPEGAVEIDTSRRNIDEVLQTMLDLVVTGGCDPS